MNQEQLTTKKGSENSIPFWMVFIGDSGVGKSQIVQRFVKDQFSSEAQTTLGAAYYKKNPSMKEQELAINIWDTSGQERYNQLVHLYLNKAEIIVVVYDVTSRLSFENVQKLWLENILAPFRLDTQIVLVGNKADLQGHREVPGDEGKQLADSFGALFLETSAKDNFGISAFYEIALNRESSMNRKFSYSLKAAHKDYKPLSYCC